MKIIDVQQGSPEWRRARLGIPTASEFKRIITSTGQPSKQAAMYARELVTETMIGEPIKDLDNLYWIERGKMLEPDAVKMYELQTDLETTPIGFITNDEGTIGCSPDRFTKNGGLLEIKCPSPQTQIGYLVDGFDSQHKQQVQGQLYITGLEWCEWFAYHPDLPPVRMRIERDEEFIKILADGLAKFVDTKEHLLKKIKDANNVVNRTGA